MSSQKTDLEKNTELVRRLLNDSEWRDKFGRILQYFSRALWGITCLIEELSHRSSIPGKTVASALTGSKTESYPSYSQTVEINSLENTRFISFILAYTNIRIGPLNLNTNANGNSTTQNYQSLSNLSSLLSHFISYKDAYRGVWKALSDARRMFRIGKDFRIAVSIEKAWLKWSDTGTSTISLFERRLGLLEAVEKSFLWTFYLLDHVCWLHKVSILKADGYEMARRRALRFCTVAWTLQWIRQCCVIWKKSEAITEADNMNSKSSDSNNSNNYKNTNSSNNILSTIQKIGYMPFRRALRAWLLIIQELHNSYLWRFHDSIVGIFGTFSACFDVADMNEKHYIALEKLNRKE